MYTADQMKDPIYAEGEREVLPIDGMFDARFLGLVFDHMPKSILYEEAYAWIEEHKGLFLSLIKQYGHGVVKVSGMDRNDLLQEIQIAVWKAFSTYDPKSGAKPSTYFYRIAENRLHKIYRTYTCSKRGFGSDRQVPLDEALEVSASNADPADDANLALDWLLGQIEALPKKERFVVRQRIKGVTQVEIAKQMGLSQASVSALFTSAKKLLNAARKEVA